jgi:nuclear transport factor 2 (NTF2) superfamily protein
MEMRLTEARPPLLPFTSEIAALKVRATEDGWNSCNPERVSLAYTIDSNGGTRASSFRADLRSSRSSRDSGCKNWTIG